MERKNPPRHDDVQFPIRMPRELRDDLRRVARAQDKSMTQILRGYARQHVADHDNAATV